MSAQIIKTEAERCADDLLGRYGGRLTVRHDAAAELIRLQKRVAQLEGLRNDGVFVRLGYPMDDTIVEGRHIAEAARVYWCTIEQKWIDSE